MDIPGLTTTRLLLALAVLCAATGSLQGLGAALLIVAVGVGRLLARGHVQGRMPVAPMGTGLTVTAPAITPLTHGRHAA
jgi:hypothetical protein